MQVVMFGHGDPGWLEPENDTDREWLLKTPEEWSLERMIVEAKKEGLFDSACVA